MSSNERLPSFSDVFGRVRISTSTSSRGISATAGGPEFYEPAVGYPPPLPPIRPRPSSRRSRSRDDRVESHYDDLYDVTPSTPSSQGHPRRRRHHSSDRTHARDGNERRSYDGQSPRRSSSRHERASHDDQRPRRSSSRHERRGHDGQRPRRSSSKHERRSHDDQRPRRFSSRHERRGHDGQRPRRSSSRHDGYPRGRRDDEDRRRHDGPPSPRRNSRYDEPRGDRADRHDDEVRRRNETLLPPSPPSAWPYDSRRDRDDRGPEGAHERDDFPPPPPTSTRRREANPSWPAGDIARTTTFRRRAPGSPSPPLPSAGSHSTRSDRERGSHTRRGDGGEAGEMRPRIIHYEGPAETRPIVSRQDLGQTRADRRAPIAPRPADQPFIPNAPSTALPPTREPAPTRPPAPPTRPPAPPSSPPPPRSQAPTRQPASKHQPASTRKPASPHSSDSTRRRALSSAASRGSSGDTRTAQGPISMAHEFVQWNPTTCAHKEPRGAGGAHAPVPLASTFIGYNPAQGREHRLPVRPLEVRQPGGPSTVDRAGTESRTRGPSGAGHTSASTPRTREPTGSGHTAPLPASPAYVSPYAPLPRDERADVYAGPSAGPVANPALVVRPAGKRAKVFYTQANDDHIRRIHRDWAREHDGQIVPLDWLVLEYNRVFPTNVRTRGALADHCEKLGLRKRR